MLPRRLRDGVMRARFRPAAAIAVVLLLAGCLGAGPLLEYTAAPATVPAAAYEPLGYVAGDVTPVPFDYLVGAGPVSTNVTVTAQVAGYSKTVDDDVAALVVVSAPNQRAFGESVNPIARLTDREAVGWALERADALAAVGGVSEVGSLGEVDVRSRTVLGVPTEVVTYAGTATVEGRGTAVLVHVATVEHGDDVILAVGVHPAGVDESESVAALVEGIEHRESSR